MSFPTFLLVLPQDVLKIAILEADYINPDDYKTDLSLFFKAMQCRGSKTKYLNLLKTEEFQNVSDELGKIISLHLNNKALEKKVIEEDLPMCKAIDDLIKDSKAEGKAEGREELISFIYEMKSSGKDLNQIFGQEWDEAIMDERKKAKTKNE